MWLKLKMVDKSDYGIASLAMLLAWAASNPMGAWLTLHPLTKGAMQGLVTIIFGLAALTAQHFWRRYLKQHWPDEKPAETKI